MALAASHHAGSHSPYMLAQAWVNRFPISQAGPTTHSLPDPRTRRGVEPSARSTAAGSHAAGACRYITQPEPELKGHSVTVQAEERTVAEMKKEASRLWPPALAALMQASAQV